MKEIEVKVTKYVAEDGTQFDDKESCEKHDAECKLNDEARDNRLSLIRAKRKKIDDENEEYERRQTLELEEKFSKIRSMKGRIESLIAIGNELSKNQFNYSEWFSGTRRVGFSRAYYDGDCQNLCVGVGYRIGDCCYLEFKTNGELMMSIKNFELSERNTIVGCFLQDFDRFESRFYEWLDREMK